MIVIIIRGPLGIGKTTIAKKLAKLLNAEYVSIDEVLQENKLDVVSSEAECIPVGNFIKANEIILPEIKEKLSQRKTIVFDGCFYYKEQIDHLIKNLKSKSFIFTLKAPLDVCIERDRKRKKSYGKESVEAVFNLVLKFDCDIVLDATKSEDEIVKKIFSRIKYLK